MAGYRVLRWQDVPSLVKAFAEDGTTVSRQLDAWFQQEIDRRAMAQRLVGSDAYLEQWEWRDAGEREGSDAEAADAVEAELLERYRGSRPS